MQVTPTFVPSKFGGVKVASYSLSKALAQRGHEVIVYTTDAEVGHSRLRNVHDIRNMDGFRVRYFKNISNLLAFKYRLFLPVRMASAVRKEIGSFDIIHLHDFRSLQSVVAYYYAKKYNIPYVLQAHGSVLRLGRLRRLKWIFDFAIGYNLLMYASGVTAGCEMEVNEYKELGVHCDKIAVIPPLYNIREFSQLPPIGYFRHKFNLETKDIVLFLGRLNKIKGIDFLIEAYQKLIQRRENAILVIIGPDDGYGAALRRLVSRLNLTSKVLFIEYLKGAEKLSALQDATMLVQVSKYERGPGSPFEAVLCGTPIIVTGSTGAGEIVSKLDAGYLVDYGNIPALVNAMQKILYDPAESLDKTRRAREYIMMNLSWEKGVEEYEGLYKSLIQNQTREGKNEREL